MSADALRDQVRALVQQHRQRDGADEAAARELMQRFEAAFAKGDVDGIVGCFAPQVQWRLPTGQALQGREAARAFLVARFADRSGPRFSGSRLAFHGDTVVQNYRVRVATPDGATRELEGCDIYRLQDGLILAKDAYWKQLGAATTAAATPDPQPRALVVPLRIGGAADAQRLCQLLRRLAASPALSQACASGALRFELSVLPAADSACCALCADGAACDAADPGGAKRQSPAKGAAPAPSTPLLRGVVTERDVKALPDGCTAAALAARAVLTPLARDALRQRGITVQPAKEA